MLLDLRLAPSEQPWPGDDEESQIDKEHERNGAGHRVEKNPRSLDITKDVPSEEKQANRDHGHVSLRERISHVTWANYTLTMSTGGIAVLLAVTPHRFAGLETIGKVVFIVDLVLFVFITVLIIARFVMHPPALLTSLTHPTESLFFPAFWLSQPSVILCMHYYGVPSTGPWLMAVEQVLFWIYVACTFTVAVLQYFQLFRQAHLTAQNMTPSWIMPVFATMLSGTVASVIAQDEPFDQRMPIIVAGTTLQGLGILVSMLFYPIYLHRLMEYGLPAPRMRPGMFIAVGPPSFTALALIGMANALPPGYSYFSANPSAIKTLQAVTLFLAIFLWALAFWFFSISLVSVFAGIKEMSFSLVWYSMVFPIVGFTINTIVIGTELESQGILGVGTAMTIIVVTVYLFVLSTHIWAVATKRILMPGKDEDKGEDLYLKKEH